MVNSIMSSRYEPVIAPLNMLDYIMFSRYKSVNIPLNMMDSVLSSRYKPVLVPCNEGQNDIYTMLQNRKCTIKYDRYDFVFTVQVHQCTVK